VRKQFEHTPRSSTVVVIKPVSSSISRIAVSDSDSPNSTIPPGYPQCSSTADHF
ncbi:MAG: hypothetical protein ACI9US_002063, partial [Gammaproteobacteria bacterium]